MTGEKLTETVVCREIEEADLPGVVACLARNFPRRTRAFWRGALARIGALATKPRYGHLLQADGRIVGVLLEIRHASTLESAPAPRCSLSSWGVDPEYRPFALVLQRRATADKATTYLNLTAAPHTFRANEAFGFRRYAEGTFVATPLASRAAPGARLVPFRPDTAEAAELTPWERAMLADHARLGLETWIGIGAGAATPFVVRLRPLWRHLIPSAQLIHARSEAEVAAFAQPIGRRLAALARLRLFVSASGPIAGLAGRYVAGRAPRYVRGPSPPAVTDMAYSELALL